MPGRGLTLADGPDSLIAIENVLGSSFDDRLLGNRGANVPVGSDGNDMLDGRRRRDSLRGGSGRNLFRARTGAPTRSWADPGATSAQIDNGLDRTSGIERRLP